MSSWSDDHRASSGQRPGRRDPGRPGGAGHFRRFAAPGHAARARRHADTGRQLLRHHCAGPRGLVRFSRAAPAFLDRPSLGPIDPGRPGHARWPFSAWSTAARCWPRICWSAWTDLDLTAANALTFHPLTLVGVLSDRACLAWAERLMENAPEFPLGLLIGELTVLATMGAQLPGPGPGRRKPQPGSPADHAGCPFAAGRDRGSRARYHARLSHARQTRYASGRPLTRLDRPH